MLGIQFTTRGNVDVAAIPGNRVEQSDPQRSSAVAS